MPIVYEENPLEVDSSLARKSRSYFRKERKRKKLRHIDAERIKKFDDYLKKHHQTYRPKFTSDEKWIDFGLRRERLQGIRRTSRREHMPPMSVRKKVKDRMREELVRRSEHYYDDMKKKIMCIVGSSGSGKTSASLYLKEKAGANVICSFTTRKKRPEETDGVEHYFVDVCQPREQLLAYTVFGGYKYYALKSQVHGECTVYVIDEIGLADLVAQHSDEYDIYSVYIERDLALRYQSRVKYARVYRDLARVTLSDDMYDYIVENNSTLEEFYEKILNIYNEIKED